MINVKATYKYTNFSVYHQEPEGIHFGGRGRLGNSSAGMPYFRSEQGITLTHIPVTSI